MYIMSKTTAELTAREVAILQASKGVVQGLSKVKGTAEIVTIIASTVSKLCENPELIAIVATAFVDVSEAIDKVNEVNAAPSSDETTN